MCLSDIDVRALLRFEPVRPKVTPDPLTARELEERIARVVPPASAELHKDIVQPRIPSLLRRQAG